jgi:hypothetical protein
MPRKQSETQESPSRTICTAIGLTASGKTTYLAALWASLQRAPKSRLHISGLQGDREYVNEMAAAWTRWETVPHTGRSSKGMLSVSLSEGASDSSVNLAYPDLAGELIDGVWTDREWPKRVDDSIRRATGILLFIHPETIRYPLGVNQSVQGWLQARSLPRKVTHRPELLAVEANRDASQAFNERDVGSIPAVVQDPPTAVRLVDLLMQVSRQRKYRTARLSIIVSAWDILDGGSRTNSEIGSPLDQGTPPVHASSDNPKVWLATHLPLLSQYLEAQGHLFPHKVFGVSALGTGWGSAEIQDTTVDSGSRAYVIDESNNRWNRTNRIDLPLRFALGLDGDDLAG